MCSSVLWTQQGRGLRWWGGAGWGVFSLQRFSHGAEVHRTVRAVVCAKFCCGAVPSTALFPSSRPCLPGSLGHDEIPVGRSLFLFTYNVDGAPAGAYVWPPAQVSPRFYPGGGLTERSSSRS
jgi:hypothetical protein